MDLKTWWLESGKSARAVVAVITRRFPFKSETKEPAPEVLARQWGRLNFQSVVRFVTKAPVFVHCHECRWPVNAGRTHMATGAGFYSDGSNALPATEEQMRRICDGVRRQMGVM